MEVQAAAISLQENNFVIVLVPMTLIEMTGEADMAIDTMQPKFGNSPVVLMAQKEDGTPRYYGDQDLVRLLAGVPVKEMPWKEYSV